MGGRLSDDEKRYFTDQIYMLKGENERLTKGIEDLQEENDGFIAAVAGMRDKWTPPDEVAKLEAKIEALWRGIKSAHLHLSASICECGEPLRETDAFDVLDTLLTEEDESMSLSEVKEKYLPNRDIEELRGVGDET